MDKKGNEKPPVVVSSPPMKYFRERSKNFLLKFFVKFTIVHGYGINEELENGASSHCNRCPK